MFYAFVTYVITLRDIVAKLLIIEADILSKYYIFDFFSKHDVISYNQLRNSLEDDKFLLIFLIVVEIIYNL